MSKKNKHSKQQKSKKLRDFSTGGVWKNDQLSQQLNKHMGLPENFKGDIKGFESTVPIVSKVLGSDKVEKIPKEEKSYSPRR